MATATRFQVRIERIVAGGDGLGRFEGRVVFVPGAAEGELHEVEVLAERKDFLRARSVATLEASPHRRPAPCPFYELCGGCSLMHLAPEAQLASKRSILLESLERSGIRASEGDVTVETLAGPELGYRNRLRFHVEPGPPGSERRAVVGFRRRASRALVDVDTCLLGSDAVNASLQGLRRLLRERPLLAKFLVEAEIMESGDASGRVLARFFVRSIDGLGFFDATGEAEILERCGLDGFVAAVAGRGPRARSGIDRLRHRLHVSASGGSLAYELEQSPESFFQSNRPLLDKLVEATVGGDRRERVLDLYCGVGLFAIPFAAISESVLGVESSASAVRDARANAARAGLGNLRFRRSDVDRFLSRASLRETDLVVADPPRGGLSRSGIEAIAGSPVREFRYVSCDPPAFGRDAARLETHGFELERLVLIDLFPNTHLFETVAFFTR